VSDCTGVIFVVECLNVGVVVCPVALSVFEFTLGWVGFSISGNVRHEFIIGGRHGSVTVELVDFVHLDNLEDDTGSNGRSSDSTATNLEESSFVLHILY
jgi:hypothetical protein